MIGVLEVTDVASGPPEQADAAIAGVADLGVSGLFGICTNAAAAESPLTAITTSLSIATDGADGNKSDAVAVGVRRLITCRL